jgi:hypothetical protein
MESQAETLGAKIETGEEIQNIESANFFKVTTQEISI